MMYKMRFPLISTLIIANNEPNFIVPLSYIEIDLRELIENHRYIHDVLDKFQQQDQLTYAAMLGKEPNVPFLQECHNNDSIKKISPTLASRKPKELLLKYDSDTGEIN